MSNFNPVNPGDLITAAYFNQVLGSFDSRISALEASIGASGGAITITALSPSGALHMGDTVTVLGQNFGLPAQAVVTVAGVIVSGSSFLPGSGNNALIFQIPPVQGIPAQGQSVQLTVSNPTSSSQPYSFTLLPYALTIPTGQIFVNMTTAPAVNPIPANTSLTFTFTITSSTSLADVYTLTPSLSNATPSSAGWSVEAVDSSGNQLSQVSIAQGQNALTTVNVKVTTGAAGSSAMVTLTVTSSANPTGLTNAGSVTVTVGASAPAPSAIKTAIAGVSAFGPGGATLAGATFSGVASITLPQGTATAVVALSLLVPDTTSSTQYTCGGLTFSPASGWAGNVAATDCPFYGQTTAVLVHLNLTTVPSGAATTTMTFNVQESGKATVTGQITPTINVV